MRALWETGSTQISCIVEHNNNSEFRKTQHGHNNLNYMNCIIIPEYTLFCWFFEEEDKTFDDPYDDYLFFWKQQCEIQGDHTGIQKWTVQTVLNMAKLEEILQAMQTNFTTWCISIRLYRPDRSDDLWILAHWGHQHCLGLRTGLVWSQGVCQGCGKINSLWPQLPLRKKVNFMSFFWAAY